MSHEAKTRVAVVTDSAADVPFDLVREYGVHVIPLQLIWNGRIDRDGVDIAPTKLYRRFRQSTTHPSITQPTIEDFVELYSQLAREAEGIVSIHLAGVARSRRRVKERILELVLEEAGS